MKWRDIRGSTLRPEHEGQTVTLAGWVARRRDHGGLIFVDLRDEGGLVQIVLNPEHAAEAAAAAHDLRNEFVIRTTGVVALQGAVDRQPGDGDGRDRGTGAGAGDRLALDAAPVPARRGGGRRDAADPLPLARPAPREDAAQHPHARQARLDHPLRDGRRGLRRHRDADHGQADARGRTRLPRPDAAPTGAVLRAAAEPADLQAAARDLRLRALLPNCPLLPRRGPARRPPPGADPARRRDGVPRPGVPVCAGGADHRADLERDDRRHARAAVPAHALRRGRPPLRQRQARSALRDGDPGRHRADARLSFWGVLRGRGRALPAGAEGALAQRDREARGDGEVVGCQGARLRRLPRRRRGQLADCQVPLRSRARALPASPGRPRSLPRPTRSSSRRCSACCGCTSAASSA